MLLIPVIIICFFGFVYMGVIAHTDKRMQMRQNEIQSRYCEFFERDGFPIELFDGKEVK